jgi:hypothetical protein
MMHYLALLEFTTEYFLYSTGAALMTLLLLIVMLSPVIVLALILRAIWRIMP